MALPGRRNTCAKAGEKKPPTALKMHGCGQGPDEAAADKTVSAGTLGLKPGSLNPVLKVNGCHRRIVIDLAVRKKPLAAGKTHQEIPWQSSG